SDLLERYQSFPSRVLDNERWFADRGAGVALDLKATFQFQSSLDQTVYLTINLYSLPTTLQFFYYLPLFITSRPYPGQTPYFSQDNYFFYDGIPTAEYISWVEQMMLERSPVTTFFSPGSLVFTAGPPRKDVVFKALGSSSNSLLFVTHQYLLKNYRRVFPGENPELRMGLALTGLGSEFIPALLGHFSYLPEPGVEYTLGLFQEKLEHQGTGWVVWERLLQSGLVDDQTELLREAYLLGQILAGLHREMDIVARNQGRWTDFNTGLVQQRLEQLNVTVQTEMTPKIPELAATVTQYLSRLATKFPERAALGRAFRIHGDLHLEQVLQTVNGWKVIDFEGEPLKSITEREYYDSPLKDLASLLRSVSYRVQTLVTMESDAWELRLQNKLLQGYRETGFGIKDNFLPAGPEFDQLINLFQLERVVYEYIYESQYRPDWVKIPLTGLRRLLEQKAKEETE
ncbi:MAG TPA: hypothetical protein VEC37_13110, partial [Bacillota bacterium]|nr:hypothetical protein [Bacillota bacterium]